VDLIHEDTKTAVHDLMDLFRIEALKHSRRAGYIPKEDRDELALTLD
jgi:hypothetical protein